MKIEEILDRVIGILKECKIEYMITGSFASNIHGIPRATFDADIVISPDAKKLGKFIERIKDDFYVNVDMVKRAIQEKRIFNVIHFDTGFKIDFIIKKDGEYYENEFRRRKPFKLRGKKYFFASPEDTILAKLIWTKKSGSEKQFNDALGIIKIQKERLDYAYLKKWANTLSITQLLDKLLKESGKR